MCIICVSRKGIRQPSDKTIAAMFSRNPHGAGYMYARDGKVIIQKGFMDLESYLDALHREHFTARDSVVYHFRISTQAGVKPEMTHPFPLTNRLEHCEYLSLECGLGVAHNGIIQLTTDSRQTRFSDTALFITRYLVNIISSPEDLRRKSTLETIFQLARSKFALMDTTGYVATVGEFINERGLLFSNNSYCMEREWTRARRG